MHINFSSPGFRLSVEQATPLTWVQAVAGLAVDSAIQVLVVMGVVLVTLVQVGQVVGLTQAAQGTLLVMGLVVRVVLATLVQVVLAVLAIFPRADPVVALVIGDHSNFSQR